MRFFTIIFVLISHFSFSQSNFQIGTKWTYEYITAPDLNVEHEPVVFEIEESVNFGGENAFRISNTKGDDLYMHIEGEKVFIWDTIIDAYQLTYDFGESEVYQSEWAGVCEYSPNYYADVNIEFFDSIHVNGWGNTPVQNMNITNTGSVIDPLKHRILKNVGKLKGGLALELGEEWCAFDYYIGDLRCFESGDISIHIYEDCDREWTQIITNTANPFEQYSNGVWTELGESIGPAYANIRWKFSEDPVTIGNYFFYNILTTQDASGDNFSPSFNFIRFDGYKIYSKTENTEEVLLYDFDTKIGDKINAGIHEFEVVDLDFIKLNDGLYRKRIFVKSADYNSAWIEGIGDIRGFLAPLAPFSENTEILCQKTENELIYENDNGHGCWVWPDATISLSNHSIILSPNPTRDEINVTKAGNMLIDYYEIYNYLGKRVKSSSFSERINIEGFDSGLFYIQFFGKDNRAIAVEPFVVNR